jgi:hypothetical protein
MLSILPAAAFLLAVYLGNASVLLPALPLSGANMVPLASPARRLLARFPHARFVSPFHTVAFCRNMPLALLPISRTLPAVCVRGVYAHSMHSGKHSVMPFA